MTGDRLMRICVFEDAGVAGLYPLCLTRPAFDLRCGTGTLLDRQRRYFCGAELGVQVRPALADLTRLAHPDLPVNDAAWLQRRGDVVFVNARWLAPVELLSEFQPSGVGVVGDRIAWVVANTANLDIRTDVMPRPLDLDGHGDVFRQVGGAMIDYPWDLVERNGDAIRDDVPVWAQRPAAGGLHGVSVLGSAATVVRAPPAHVEPPPVLDATKWPIVFDRRAVVPAL